MDLTYLLSRKGVDTKTSRVLVMRHVPKEPRLRKRLPWLAAGEPHVFNAYQQSQSPKAEKQLTQAAYLASFIGHKAGEALFVGIYCVSGHQPISYEDFWKIPANTELRKLGFSGWTETDYPPSALWFDLALTDIYTEWKGKLIIEWPAPEIAWARWADRNEFPVKAILDESILIKGVPSWNELLLTWEELRHLPTSWVQVLSGWTAIYFILDGADGKGYVGSAYGDKKLYGRWSNYRDSGDGGNKLLRERT
jgi:hypothetical protein